jgi:hypothetical protein
MLDILHLVFGLKGRFQKLVLSVISQEDAAYHVGSIRLHLQTT